VVGEEQGKAGRAEGEGVQVHWPLRRTGFCRKLEYAQYHVDIDLNQANIVKL